MSRDRLDEELNSVELELRLDDILDEFRGWTEPEPDMSEPAPKPVPPSAPARREQAPLPLSTPVDPRPAAEPEEEPEEDVRIYRPGRERRKAPAAPSAETAQAAEKDSGPGEKLAAAFRGLMNRVRPPQKPAAKKPAPAPAPEDLPSFEDLVWGKKEAPVRISEETEARAPAPPTAAPRQAAEEPPALTLEDILADYRAGEITRVPERAPGKDTAPPAFSVEEILADHRTQESAAPAPSYPRSRAHTPSRPQPARTAPPAAAVREQPRARSRESAPSPAHERKTEAKKDEDVEFGAMSVDRILAEYKDILAAMPPETPAPEKAADDKSAGQLSRMEREARSYIAQRKKEDFAGLREEADYERPKPAPAEEAPAPVTASEPSRPAPAPAPVPTGDEGIDPRFRLDGTPRTTMVFGGKELDLSADESYTPPKAAAATGFHWVAGEEELHRQPVKKRSLLRREKPEAPETDEIRAEGYEEDAKAAYAPAGDYEAAEEEPETAFPSFGQYLSGLVTGLLVRVLGVRRIGKTSTGTVEEDEEDLGPEVRPASASKYYGSFVLSLKLRLRIGLVLLAVMAWIALGLPVTGALRSVQVASAMALAIQLVIMLLCLDIVTGAAVNLARGRFGADSLAVLSCVLTSFDALAVTLGVLGTPHMPLCLVSSSTLVGVLLSSLVSARALRKALRVPAIGKRCYAVTGEPEVTGKGLTLLKSLRPPKGFVRRTEEAAPDETLFTRLAPLLLLLALPMTLIVGAVKHALGDFLFILTAILCPAVPLTALLAFALPYLFGSLRIFQSGAAIAGWSGLTDIGRSADLIVTDRDLFPEGSVELDTVRIFADVKPETIISYAGTMICASGSDLAPCFAELMEKNGCPMRRVEGFEYLSGGGMKGVIDGSVVLCGGVDLMRLMNVRIPYRLVGKTTVLLSVDGILCGIFNMKYEGQPQVRKALVGLIRSNRHPIFAIRDFLVTPEMLSGCFDVATDGYDFPPYVDRFAISEAKPAETSKIAAVVCREGLGPLVHMADTGRSMYLVTRVNLVLTALAAVAGVIAVFVRLLTVGTVGSGFLLLFLLLWALPVAVISVFLRF